MSGKIFISYRRGDDPGYTQAVFQLLLSEFAREQLFMDVAGYIKPGDDFVRILDEYVRNCEILLAIIGPRWIDARNEKDEIRLNDPNDFVRIEIALALKQGKRVIPVLVNNASMPPANRLPKPLRPLAKRNAVRLTHERFAADCQDLIKAVRDALTPRNLSNVLLSGTCVLLAGAFAWMASALRAESTSPGLLVVGFALVAIAFLIIAALALLRYSRPETRKREPESERRQGTVTNGPAHD